MIIGKVEILFYEETHIPKTILTTFFRSYPLSHLEDIEGRSLSPLPGGQND